MNWINVSSILAIVVSLIVFVQGLSILRVAGTDQILRIIGFLTVVLATLGIMICALFLSTEIMLSPEFGAIIIQGRGTVLFFDLFLLGLILCIAWGWDLARLRAEWQPLGWRLHAAGFLIWGMSIVILLQRANSPAFDAPPIFLYDIWWPPLPLWFIIGFTNISLTILKVNSVALRFLLTEMVVVCAALFILFLAEPTTGFVISWTQNLWLIILAGAIAILLLSLAVLFVRRLRSLGKPVAPEQTGRQSVHGQLAELGTFARRIEREQIFMLLSLCLIVSGLIMLLFTSSTRLGPAPGILLGPGPGLLLIVLGLGAITEVVTDGWFAKVYQGAQSGRWSGPVGKASNTVQGWLAATGGRVSSMLSLSHPWTAILKLLVAVALLTVANEILNYGRTIIQSFQAIGVEESSSLVDSIDDRLINELVQLNQQLQPAILLPTSSTSGSKIDYIQASNAAGSLDAVLANSGEFEFGTVKIPANVIVSPLQGLVRPWFQVRVVSGNLIEDDNGFIVLANANNGGTWVADETKEKTLERALPALVKELSFVMISSSESLQRYGLTNNWEAFKSFQQGIRKIQEYESKGDSDALMEAVQAFKDATLEDTNFALAYYRLGLALQQNRQPWQAETALRAALALKPDSITFKNALAYHYYFYNDYAPAYPPMVPVTPVSDMERKRQSDQAIQLWHQIVNLPAAQVPVTELASAYSGLCRAGVDQASYQISGWLDYFYCYKSQTLLERLPNQLYSQEKIRQAVAENLVHLGFIIDNHSTDVGNLDGWYCLPSEISEKTGLLAESVRYGYSRAGLQYYKKALELRPQDTYIQCNAAINAKLLEDPALMDDLKQNPQSHYELATKYLDKASSQSGSSTEPSPYYQAAITEYKKAIDSDPMYHEALNGYAYTYWVFRLQFPEAGLESLGPQFNETLPAYYANKALHLARVQQDQELEVIYGSTLAEVLLAQGQPQRALQILLELEPNIPENYMFDQVRWDLAQAYLCAIDEKHSREKMEKKAEAYLNTIREHERLLEISLFSQPEKDWLQTGHRLPFCDPSNSP